MSGHVNLDWMMALRSRKNGSNVLKRVDSQNSMNLGGKGSEKKRNGGESPHSLVPKCYFVTNKHPNKKYRENDYKGNFSDISHLTKREKLGHGSLEIS